MFYSEIVASATLGSGIKLQMHGGGEMQQLRVHCAIELLECSAFTEWVFCLKFGEIENNAVTRVGV